MTVGEGLDPPETVPLMPCAFQMVALREATCQDDLQLFACKEGPVVKQGNFSIESVGAIINRPRAVNDRPYIRRM